ncbi:MAG: D-tyrosyl-tRNA(Tyr) deacylase [Geodermatophilaceae bacterium]|nr:D-tyrosyl-tRNA(Tyr) deacylase [Geodermatophilaceae bacterium]MDQ3463217.1 D-aminoacyl-tRNA deacylase [Actinomycetota bacterium]
MRAVVQRVSEASVTIDEQRYAAIGPGLLALVGVTHDDDPGKSAGLARRLHELRLFDDGRSSVADLDLEILVVSQFTLYGDISRGRRPSWLAAAPGAVAEPLVDAVVAALRERGARVQTGRFGADMAVGLVNDGPVTLVLEL